MPSYVVHHKRTFITKLVVGDYNKLSKLS
jgi:hypothetical protein